MLIIDILAASGSICLLVCALLNVFASVRVGAVEGPGLQADVVRSCNGLLRAIGIKKMMTMTNSATVRTTNEGPILHQLDELIRRRNDTPGALARQIGGFHK